MSDVVNSSHLSISGSTLGTELQHLLLCDEIVPGTDVSYQICKTLYLYHPLGGKLAETPVSIAQSQTREIAVPKGPESRVKDAFMVEWDAIGADRYIFNVMRMSRIYGIASIVFGAEGIDTEKPIDFFDLPDLKLYFNVLDPLNTAGSMVLNQNPNSPDFQRVESIVVQGAAYHRSRSCVIMNGSPIYISYSASAFGFVGRSVYQRALYPLKSFVQSMITDDMVTRKAGVLIAKMKAPGSVINNLMTSLASVKRNMLREAKTDNVLGIGIDEDIQTLNMQNVDGAAGFARKNILENIAASADDMPAILLNSETFSSGLAEGSEDAKRVARYVERIRVEMRALYVFFDKIVMYRAWNEDFYKIVQEEFPEYKKVPFKQAFFEWANSFKATWPSLLIEPDSEKSKTEEVKLTAIISLIEVLLPNLDSDNKATLLRWAADNVNENKVLFSSPLELDWEAIAAFAEKQQGQQDQAQEAQNNPPGGAEEGGGPEGKAPGAPATQTGKQTPKAPAPEKLKAA